MARERDDIQRRCILHRYNMATVDKVVRDNADVETDNTRSPNSNSFTLQVLQVLRESQQQHGLRHGDYQRYRQYCSRRLRRIRKSLNFPQGTRNRVQPKKITQTIFTDVKYLYCPLVEAERAWAYAMQLKAEANSEPRKRFHMICRLRKAVQHTATLAALGDSDNCDALTKLEVQAYHAWMKANLQFELSQWKAAIELFTNAKTIYEKLGSAFVDDVRDIYEQRVAEISPSIRYCAHNIGDESAIDDLVAMRMRSGQEDALTSNLDELLKKTREKQASSLLEVTWRGRTVPVRTEAVRLLLLSLRETDGRQDAPAAAPPQGSLDARLSVCESTLKELIDAQQALRDDFKDDQVMRAMLRGQPLADDRVPNTVYLYTYLAYLRQLKTVERNLLLIESLKRNMRDRRGAAAADGVKKTKPQDLGRLYDIIAQNLTELLTLPGLEHDDDFKQEIMAEIVCYKAFRCFYIAQTYADARKWRECTALYERTRQYGQEAATLVEGLAKAPSSKLKSLMTSVDGLVKEVEGLSYSCRASSILEAEGTAPCAPTKAKVTKPLMERLDEYNEGVSAAGGGAGGGAGGDLIRLPPDFEPVPCKPLFYDVALSYVAFPELQAHIEAKKSGGLTGMVKGWLWGGKK